MGGVADLFSKALADKAKGSAGRKGTSSSTSGGSASGAFVVEHGEGDGLSPPSGTSGTFGSTSNPANYLQYLQLQSYLVESFGLPSNLAGAYVNMYADGFYNDETRQFEGLSFGDDFILGAVGIAGVSLPDQFVYNGQAYDSTSGIPTPIPLPDPGVSSATYPPYLAGIIERGRNAIAAERGPLPVLSEADIASMLAGVRPSGGGGGGRRGPVFDRNQVIEGVNSGYQAYLLDTPGNAGEKADRYISEATAFARQGGSLDFQTWLLNEMRGSARYNLIYKNKPDSMSEADFIGQYRGVVGQFGLPTRQADDAVIRGASNAAAPQAFANSLARTREVQAMGTGRVSRQFANLLNQTPGLRA